MLTSIPAPELAPIGAFSFPGADKLVHAGLYAILGALVARAAHPRANRVTLGRLLIGIAAFAAADEWHQRFIPGRSADIRDFAADCAGAVAGLAATTYILRRKISLS
jgi:VanZ family protein